MKAEFIRCPHCGLLHPATALSCPATGAEIPRAAPDATRPGGVADTQSARLVVPTAEGERTFYLRPTNSLGRHPNNSIQILDKIVSKEHCRIERDGDRYVLRDLGSLNGTFVNGERVRGFAPLSHGDIITLGATRAFFYEASAPAPTSTEVDTAAERFLAHLTVDKPIYRPGEMLFARAAVLDAYHRAPLGRTITLAFEVRSPRGEIIVSRAGQVAAGIAPFSWSIPDDLPGGDYSLLCLFPADGFPSAEIGFSVLEDRASMFDVVLAFARRIHGPGDEVEGSLSVSRVEGGVPASARLFVEVAVDGAEIHRSDPKIDAAGAASIRFRLPQSIDVGEGTVTITVAEGSFEETLVRRVPIAVRRVGLALYPEGGDLVAQIPARLYFDARTPKGKPVDVAGRIIDGSGAVLARFRTEHEGRGRVACTPAVAGRAYMAVLDEPAGVTELFPLPEIAAEGIVLTALDDEIRPEEAVRVQIASTAAQRARVVLFCREREVAAVRVDLAAGEPKEVALTPPGAVDGVLRVAVFDAAGLPRAERLVYRRPVRGLKVSIEPAAPRAPLRSRAEVRIRTTNAEGAPVPAMLTVSVVDDVVLQAIDRRDRHPRLPAQVLLGPEVRDLGDPESYLEGSAASARRLDLLLGVQGWRRFAFHDVSRFIAEHGDRADRALARRRPVAPALAMIMSGPPRGVVVGPQPQGQVVVKPSSQDTALNVPKLAGLPEPNAPTAPRAPLTPQPRGAAPKPDGPAPSAAIQRLLARRASPDRAQPNLPAPRPAAPAVLREYAHRAPPFEGTRSIFPDTLHWSAGLQTREAGEATIAFDLCDAITTFRVRADAFGADGALGQGDATIEARSPLHLDPRIPAEVSAGDVIDLPVALVNDTADALDAQLSLAVSGSLLAARDPLRIAVAPGTRERTLIPLAVGPGQGVFSVDLSASAGPHADRARRAIAVVPAGFPAAVHAGGLLEPGARAEHAIEIPEAIEPGSLSAEIRLSPAPTALIAAALDALSRDPAGCFAQASAVGAVSALALRALAARPGADPALAERAAIAVERAARDLAAFECKGRGFEQFGADPAHEAQTAEAILALAEIAQVHPVDEAILARARVLCLARRDGRGGFARGERALEAAGGAPEDIASAYITWALAKAGVPGLDAEIGSVRARALETEDSYLLALGAGILADAGDPAAPAALDRLTARQDEGGAVRGLATSISGSSGAALILETTALAVLAWARAGQIVPALKGLRWILARAQGGRFGTAPITVLALKAILACDALEAKPRPAAGAARVRVGGELAAEVSFGADPTGPIALPSFARNLSPGAHRVEIELEGGAPMPYAIEVRYRLAAVPLPTGSPLSLTTTLARDEVAEGEGIQLFVDIVNTMDHPLPMVTAVIGVPAGLEPRVEQLRAFVKEGRLDAWEARGREVVLYRRSMAPGEGWSLPLALIGAIPGTYQGPPSRAYLLTAGGEPIWAPPLRVRVVAGR